jgi:hypothetical protein
MTSFITQSCSAPRLKSTGMPTRRLFDCGGRNILQIENVFNRAAPYFSVSNPLFLQNKILNRICAVILIAAFFALPKYVFRGGQLRLYAYLNRLKPIKFRPDSLPNSDASILSSMRITDRDLLLLFHVHLPSHRVFRSKKSGFHLWHVHGY